MTDAPDTPERKTTYMTDLTQELLTEGQYEISKLVATLAAVDLHNLMIDAAIYRLSVPLERTVGQFGDTEYVYDLTDIQAYSAQGEDLQLSTVPKLYVQIRDLLELSNMTQDTELQTIWALPNHTTITGEATIQPLFTVTEPEYPREGDRTEFALSQRQPTTEIVAYLENLRSWPVFLEILKLGELGPHGARS